MLLTEIAEWIVTQLNSSPEKWTEDSGVVARNTIDWATCLRDSNIQVLVVPEMVQYNMEASTGRTRKITVNTLKMVSVMIGKGFTSLPTNDDVAPWAECKELLNVRERVTQFLIDAHDPRFTLVDIEEIPVDELELNHRNFIAVSQFGYELLQCGSAPNLRSS